VSSPELSVVCKSCGSEVSPYVTECPYCGHRLRKRAPDLEREGDEIKVREGRREKRRRQRRERALERQLTASPKRRRFEAGDRPVATIGVLLVAATLMIVMRAVPLSLAEAGAIVGPVGSEVWRYLTAPFVYEDLGALIVIGAAIAIFGSALERRLGSVATLFFILAAGGLAMLAADAVAGLGFDEFLVAAGGNGVALALLGAWLMLARAEGPGPLGSSIDLFGVVTITVVLLLMPLVEVTADPIAGLAGALLGLLMGRVAAARAPAGSD
jgi:membrane associated rhomboid family serine protease